MKKKLLILGAMAMHLELIKRAREIGFYVITCDYIPENPGHKIADEAHFDSTTDLNAVLELAKKCQIDAIMTYNSDPAAVTVAYVAEKLGLPGNPYQSVKVMSEKDLFRDFLRKNDLNVPAFSSFSEVDAVVSGTKDFQFPVIVKPVDSSGSKGVTLVMEHAAIRAAAVTAIQKSRAGRIVVEEYIEPVGRQLHGDGFVNDGKLEFLCLGDHYFDVAMNNFVPYSTAYPTAHSPEVFTRCKDEIQEFISKVGFKNGGINVELRVSKRDGKVYIIDIGARNGGNFTPKIIEYATGFNFLDRAIKVAAGEAIPAYSEPMDCRYYSHLILHSDRDGIFKRLNLSDELEKRIVESHIYSMPGEQICKFDGANNALGVLIMRYKDRADMEWVISNFNSLYSVELDG